MSATKLSANLPNEVMNALNDLAEQRCTTKTEVLRRAITLEKWLQDEVFAKNGKLLAEVDGQQIEIKIL